MALKAILAAEEHAKLGDALKGEYVEDKAKPGRYTLQVAPVDGWGLEDVGGLKSALAREREAAAAHAKRLEIFGDLDPGKARDALGKIKEWGEADPGEKAKKAWLEKEAALLEKHKAEIAAREASLSDVSRQLEDQLVTAAATAAIAKHKGSVDLLLPHVKARTKVEKDQAGKFVARVVDERGTARVTMRTGSTDPMSIDEFVETMKTGETYAPAFAGSGATGSGATGSMGGGAGSHRSHQISVEDQRDVAKYRAARAAAEKAGGQVSYVE